MIKQEVYENEERNALVNTNPYTRPKTEYVTNEGNLNINCRI
jgi:hypothetical protein